MKKTSVEFLLENQSHQPVVSLTPEDGVIQAAKTLKQHGIGLLLVISKGDMVGVLSERDIVQRWVGGPKFPQDIPISEIMTRNVEYVTAFDTVIDCYLRFVARGCRHLPVLDPMGNPIGVLSLRNVFDYVISENPPAV